MTLEVDIINGRYKKFYKDVVDDLDKAKTAYSDGDANLADLYLKQATVKSNILIAERLDILGKILSKDE
jgi:hypothetical protein